MTNLDILDIALRIATLLVVTSSLGVAIAALRTVRAGIAAMAVNAAQRAAEHDRRHSETLAALAQRDTHSRRQHDETMAALDVHRQALETLIARTAPAAAD